MPTNTQITASLVATGEIPPDQECNINSLSAIRAGLIANTAIESSAPESGGQGDSIANQALNTANQALAQVTELTNAIPQRRDSGSPLIEITNTGNSSQSISWQPSMPDTNYMVQFTIFGPANATGCPTILVANNSRTVNSCQLRITDTPGAGSWYFAYQVIALTTA